MLKFFLRFKNFFLKKKSTSKSQKVFHITRSFKKSMHGGIEQVIKNMSIYIPYEHEVLSTNKTYNFFKEKNIVCHNFKKTFSLFKDVFSYDLLKYLIKNEKKFNIILIHYPHVLAFLYLILMPFRKKIIVVYHSDILRQRYLNFLVKIIFYIMNNFVDCYYISSKKYLNNSLIKDYSNKTLTEFFSIPFKFNLSKKKDYKEKFVLFISKNRHYKGFDYLEKLISQNLNIKFVCVTDYKFKSKFKNLKIYKNISETKKINLIQKSTCLISTSINRAESFGMSMLEGLIFNKPLMCFNLDTGINEIVIDKKNGFVIKKFDLDNYSKKLNLIYNDIDLQKKLSNYSAINKKKFMGNYKKLHKKIIDIMM